MFEASGYELSAARSDRAQLIAAGWYQEKEIDMVFDNSGDTMSAEVKVRREKIHNHYSRIPLHIMARAARENGIVFTDMFDKDQKVPAELTKARQEIEAYVNGPRSKQSEAEHWHHNEDWLRKLRNQDLHFSAKYELGLNPRFKDGKRWRQTYDG